MKALCPDSKRPEDLAHNSMGARGFAQESRLALQGKMLELSERAANGLPLFDEPEVGSEDGAQPTAEDRRRAEEFYANLKRRGDRSKPATEPPTPPLSLPVSPPKVELRLPARISEEERIRKLEESLRARGVIK